MLGLIEPEPYNNNDYRTGFVDERKYLQAKSNLCALVLGRLSMVIFNFMMLVVYLVVYSKDKNYLDRNASLSTLIVFVAAQVISFLVLHPLFILL